MDKGLIDRFSRYYKGGGLQENIGKSLIALINCDFQNILEIGCGDGQFTRMIKKRLTSSKIISLDISEKMINLAKNRVSNVRFVVADGEVLPFKTRFNLIISNACFQWFKGLFKSLMDYKNFLSKGGVLLFSIFGKNTLKELSLSLDELFKAPVKIRASGFFLKDEIEEIMEGAFKNIKIKNMVIKQEYGSIIELLKEIRYSSSTPFKMLWTKGMIERLDRIYKDKFGGIFATYEVFLCKGEKSETYP